MSIRAKITILDAPIRDVLIDLVRQYRHVPALRFARPRGGKWTTFSFEGQTATLCRNGAMLRLAVEAKDHAFASLKGSDNIVSFQTTRYNTQPMIVRGPGAGPEVTAAGVFADLLRLASFLGAPQ